MKSLHFETMLIAVLVFHWTSLSKNVAANDPKRAVILGLDVDGYMPSKDTWKKEFFEALETKLRQVNQTPVRSSETTPCENEGCIEQRLKDSNSTTGVYVKITTEIGQPPSYLINLIIYQKEAAPQLRQQEARCYCSEYQIKERLSTLFGELFYAKNAPQVLLTKSAAQKSVTKKALWFTVGAVGSLLVAGSAIALGVSAAQHGQDTCGASLPNYLSCPTDHDNTTVIALSAVGLGVGVILAPLGFVLGAKVKSSAAPKVSFLPNGIGFTLTGVF